MGVNQLVCNKIPHGGSKMWVPTRGFPNGRYSKESQKGGLTEGVPTRGGPTRGLQGG
jgi:hypothetical protein